MPHSRHLRERTDTNNMSVITPPLAGAISTASFSQDGVGTTLVSSPHASADPELRIIYVEDHEVTRVGTIQLLKRIAPEVFIQEAQFFSQLVELSKHEHDYDLLLLDLSLPDVAGVVQVSTVKDLFPDIPIVVFSAFEDSRLVMSAMKAGASGFLLKKSPSRTIIQAIQLILDGEMFFPRQLIAELSGAAVDALSMSPSPAPREMPSTPWIKVEDALSIPELTPRQLDVLRLVAKGLSNKEIARALGISVGTTKNHVAEILRLMGCTNRRDAICKVLNGDVP